MLPDLTRSIQVYKKTFPDNAKCIKELRGSYVSAVGVM